MTLELQNFDKNNVRQHIWDLMETQRLVSYPLPLAGRIPNFQGSAHAAYKLCSTPEFRSATVVKIHPSLNAERLRFLSLKFGKKVLTPPLPGHSFLYFLLDPASIPPRFYKFAATKRGFNKLGTPCALADIPPVDLVVVATVACTRTGARLGKGKGYGEVEYGILREIGRVTEETPVATIVHDVQLVEEGEIPARELACHDLPVDIICTPTTVVRTRSSIRKPGGIFWDMIQDQMIKDIGALEELKTLQRSSNLNVNSEAEVQNGD